MATKVELLACLSYIDMQLDELQEEFGDLPEQVSEKKLNAEALKEKKDETEGFLKDIRDFVATAKITLVELKEKEDNLAKQQFMARNNKEFDAISKEIEHLKSEHEKLSTRMRTEGLKEENLMRILEGQIQQYNDAEKDYQIKLEEFDSLSIEQNDDVKLLTNARKTILVTLPKETIEEYKRIRRFHTDVAVKVKRNSCSGCFSAVPSQKIVELRNNPDKEYHCENCGRVLIPEEMPTGEELLKQLNIFKV